jgi:hypothetical protein
MQLKVQPNMYLSDISSSSEEILGQIEAGNELHLVDMTLPPFLKSNNTYNESNSFQSNIAEIENRFKDICYRYVFYKMKSTNTRLHRRK